MDLEVFLSLARKQENGGYHLIRPTVLAQFVPPQEEGKTNLPKRAVYVHGVTDQNYKINPDNAKRVEISFANQAGRHFVHPKDLVYPVPK